MPLNDRLLAVRWACGSVFCISVLALLALMGAIFCKPDAALPIGVAAIASQFFLQITFVVSLRLLVRWLDPSPEDRERIRSMKIWGGTYGIILVIWTLADAEATSPFFKNPNRWA